MIRPVLLLSVTPFLTACGLEELFNPGSSQRAHGASIAILAALLCAIISKGDQP